MSEPSSRVKWIGLSDALANFASASDGVQGQGHIRPLHWYIACRLCIEGGFHPDEITPRPPFEVENYPAKAKLIYSPDSAGSGEQTIFGGLKTKKVDVVVTKQGIGPVVAVSVKGTLNAFRNLTNRMEEAGGDCTNLHLTYPALVYGFWSVLRATRSGAWNERMPFASKGGQVSSNDVSVDDEGDVVTAIRRYHLALSGLSGRSGIRDDVSKYEAVCVTLADVESSPADNVFLGFPPKEDPLHLSRFFQTLYDHYDLRFVYQAPDLARQTRRAEWLIGESDIEDLSVAEYVPRLRVE